MYSNSIVNPLTIQFYTKYNAYIFTVMMYANVE